MIRNWVKWEANWMDFYATVLSIFRKLIGILEGSIPYLEGAGEGKKPGYLEGAQRGIGRVRVPRNLDPHVNTHCLQFLCFFLRKSAMFLRYSCLYSLGIALTHVSPAWFSLQTTDSLWISYSSVDFYALHLVKTDEIYVDLLLKWWWYLWWIDDNN